MAKQITVLPYSGDELKNKLAMISRLEKRITDEENKVDNDTIYDDEELRGLITALTDRISVVEANETSLGERMTAEENKVDNDTLYDDTEIQTLITQINAKIIALESREEYDDTEVRDLVTAISSRVTELEESSDADTIYDDTEVRGLIAALNERLTAEENKVDNDTIYDDTELVARVTALEQDVALLKAYDTQDAADDEEVRGLISALTSRVAAVEEDSDDDTIYDDSEVRGLITALAERVTAVENRVDEDTIYNDEEVRGLIDALSARLTAVEEDSDDDTIYDDSEVRGLITALTSRVAEVEGRTDNDTLYDDTELRTLISTLSDRVTAVEEDSDDDTIYDDTEVREIISELSTRVAEVEAREDSDTIYDDTELRTLIGALNERIGVVEDSSDADTIYDDAEVRGLITALTERVAEVEGRTDEDTIYDDEEVRGLIASLAERLTAVEESSDDDTIYDDTEVRSLITALTARMTAEENKVDNDTVYDDEELRGLITALTTRVSELEEDSDDDTIYDDTEIRSLITALTERLTAEENKVDNDTVYDDTELQEKYDTLNDKYNELFNFVYASATPAQATMMNPAMVNNTFANGETSVEITNGELGDVTIPETTKGLTIEAPMQDGATITLSSPKYIYLNNTSEAANPGSVTIVSPEPTGTAANTTIYAGGEYDTITLNNASLNVNSKLDELQVENVVVENTAEEPKSNSITAVFVGENPSVSSETATSLTINNKNATSSDEDVDETPDMTINAPNATVTLNNSWDNVSSTVGDNTLMIGTNTRINKLTVLKGNVIVKDTVTTRCINQVVNETEYTVDVYRKTVMDGNELNSSLINNCGYTILGDDITRNRLTWGVFGSGNYVLDLNGHTLTISDAMFGLKARNAVNLTIVDSVGTGKFINDKAYGLWAGENTTITVDVPETTEIIGETHTLYCEGSGKPTINVINGVYKMTIADDATDVYDANGNYKFMLNHLDSTYTREGNCFNITGGTFYGFDPSRMNGDPGAEYSMIDDNAYEVQVVGTFVDSRETTMNIYKVVAKA